jgi:heme/copper-type cytochrome/quinol oxidase subunit 2
MHFALLVACALAALVVFAVMLHSIATFRKARVSGPAAFMRSAFVETLWAIVPVAILFGAAAPAVKSVVEMRQAEASTFAMNQGRAVAPKKLETTVAPTHGARISQR